MQKADWNLDGRRDHNDLEHIPTIENLEQFYAINDGNEHADQFDQGKFDNHDNNDNVSHHQQKWDR